RRAGLARKLVRAAMELAVTQYRVAHVFLEVGAENHGARDLYSGLGFICRGRRKHYYAKMDALMMRCDLTQGGSPASRDEKEGGAQP
ncbi:MAG: N-acetyltransferase, partial [Pseudomonadota bacterium]|nr:N-acetyltransferase [Pseudomonadota bacterium]